MSNLSQGPLATCFELPFVGSRSLRDTEIQYIDSNCHRNSRSRIRLAIAAMTLVGIAVMLGNADLNNWGTLFLVAGPLTFAALSLRWDERQRSARILKEIHGGGEVHRYQGRLPGFVMEHDDPPPPEFAHGRVFEANLEAFLLLNEYLDPKPDVDLTIEVFPESQVVYAINGKIPKSWYKAHAKDGEELFGDGRTWEH